MPLENKNGMQPLFDLEQTRTHISLKKHIYGSVYVQKIMLSTLMYKYIQNIPATYIRMHNLNTNKYMHAQGILPKKKLHISIYKAFCYQILHMCILWVLTYKPI